MQSNFSVREALQWGILKLKKAGVETPVLDAELILVHVASPSPVLSDILSPGERNEVRGRAWIYGHLDEPLNIETFKHFKGLIRRRGGREPVAYIVGHKEFYGLDFLVNKNVLIPRPETELLVEQAFLEMKNVKCKIKNEIAIVDVGTGSGAIAVAAARECRIQNVECRIVATDVSAKALTVARENARRNGVDGMIRFLRGNLLEPVFNFLVRTPSNSPSERGRNWQTISSPARGEVRRGGSKQLMIVANLPYLPTTEWREAMPEVRKFEPRGALDGGRDGLKYYRELFQQLLQFLSSRGVSRANDVAISSSDMGKRLPRSLRSLAMTVVALCEICPEQATPFKKMVRDFFPRAKCDVIKDLSGRNRAVKVRLN